MKSHPPIYTNATKESVLLLFNQDVSSAHIAQVLHISQETVFAILDDTSRQRKGLPPEVITLDKLPSIGSLIMDYKPEAGTLDLNLQLKSASPSSVEWLTALLAQLLNQPAEPAR
ncbi:hypothetical protein GO755_04920 [Spirosoma sp. HMF4905]|uniref:Helix-turn-helix domain-containing protein n=1 Tax=Spirosoma arboris TaxID=2682092 RepID=A0A7K1S723_9BACT|nr:hypothetical protein [Spirosoma arboris]MVM29366.1 hypothetical protein [Spirosoma arboris]